MSTHRYKVGDWIVLNGAPIRFISNNGPCRIVAALPASFQEPQYRVRFESENFERCIAESDIDSERSARASPAEGDSDRLGRSGWVTPLTTTIKR
ncbi:hypothetical protein J2Z31_001718 [Sinorhizobium kostiense]|uniref:Cold shock protein n=1 Tax=Sinorhizobium kostiense TaxID=76747 RepID=A0ABS4QYJ7_9HYPH|nr:cold-shock protein [Sinorhizobium kostiense]MBP2235226.1 hypothetical protein [Sinorhizobium kostiense]